MTPKQWKREYLPTAAGWLKQTAKYEKLSFKNPDNATYKAEFSHAKIRYTQFYNNYITIDKNCNSFKFMDMCYKYSQMNKK